MTKASRRSRLKRYPYPETPYDICSVVTMHILLNITKLFGRRLSIVGTENKERSFGLGGKYEFKASSLIGVSDAKPDISSQR